MARKCPRCGLVSPQQSERCQCGFYFDFDDRAAVLHEHDRWRESARAHLWGGLALIALGVVTMVASFVVATERGGYYYVWIGAFIGGGTLVATSIMRLRAIREIERPLEDDESAG
jgi:hypothetical protein